MERAFFNAAPATVARDFKTHVYFQSPNRISASLPGDDRVYGAKGDKDYQSRFNFHATHRPKCCTFNLHRMLPNYVMHYGWPPATTGWRRRSMGRARSTRWWPTAFR